VAAARALPIGPRAGIAPAPQTAPATRLGRAGPAALQLLPIDRVHGREAAPPVALRTAEQQHAPGHDTALATFIAHDITDTLDGGIIATGTIVIGTVAGG
jgi:hypothetical protein